MMGSLASHSMTRATSAGCLVSLTATTAAPPGSPEQAAGPQGCGIAHQSNLSPIVLENWPICQEPDSYMTTLALANSSFSAA
ncbi:hypothetical protein D3C83_176260 [compost metagenome]